MKVLIEDLIALRYIIDSMPQLNNDFKKIMLHDCDVPVVMSIASFIHFDKIDINFWDSKVTKEIKLFCQKYKEELNIIKRYSALYYFFMKNFDSHGNITTFEDNNFNFFYQYFLSHRNELDQIVMLLEKLVELGFTYLEFDEQANFEVEQYKAYTKGFPYKYYYLENIEVISNYDKNWVKYETLGSNYRFLVCPKSGGKKCRVDSITVSNLLFDVDKLPETLSQEILFKEINEFLNLYGNKWSKAREDIGNVVNISDAYDDLVRSFEKMNEIIENMENAQSKDEFVRILLKLKKDLKELEIASLNFNDGVCENNLLVNEEEIKKAKQKRLERRMRDYTDFH